MIKKTYSYLAMSISVIFLGMSLGAFSFAATDACHAKTATITDGSASKHPYTCQEKSNTSGLCGNDGSVDQLFSESCSSSTLSCHRCICPSGTSWDTNTNKCKSTTPSCDSEKGLVLSSDGTSCVCKVGEQNAAGYCVEKIEALTTPTKGVTVDEPKTTAATVELTPEELCDARIKNKEDVKRDGNACVSCTAPGVCCGVELNTNVPFVGKCIRLGNQASSSETNTVTETTAFPRLMGGLTKILTTIILLVSFGGIIVGGVMIASSGGDSGRAKTGKELIGKIIMAIAILGASGIILHLINPNFF